MQSGIFGFPPGRILKSKTFYASEKFGVPLGVHMVWLTGVAPGGAGGRFYIGNGANSVNTSFSGGGGAGEVARRIAVSVIDGIIIPVSIGAAGTAGQAGGNLTFGNLLTLIGGEAGDGWDTVSGGVTSGRFAGGKFHGQPSSADGRGGDSPWGKGGILNGPSAIAVNTAGANGSGYGAGGSGCYANALSGLGASLNGGNGSPGFLRIEWFEDF